MKIEDTVLLCKKCHHAAEHGKILCSQYKKNHHNPRYPICYSCYKQNKQEFNKTAEPCIDEIEGYCNHLGEYFYGERVKCERLLCSYYILVKNRKKN